MTCMLHYCFQMYLKALGINVLIFMNLILHIFLSVPGLAWQACLKKTKVKDNDDNDMLMMVENGLRGGICQAV